MDNFLKEFKKRIYKRQIKFAVVGLGYVGLPLAVEFAKRGFCVLGIDLDTDRIEKLKKKKSYILDVKTEDLKKVIMNKRFTAVTDFRLLKEADVVLICVPTPLKRKYSPDISFITQAVKAISKNIKKKVLVILESTTYPGTTKEIILPILEANGLKHGRDFYLCFSPERIDPGNTKYPLSKIPKIVGGISREATSLGTLVYKIIINKVIPVSSTKVAETVKLLENTFRLINIGLINEMAMMCHKMDIDIWGVIEAAKTKPFGFMPFYPGPGVGGHCLDRNEILCIRDKDSLKIMQMPDFIKYIQNTKDNDVEVLSFDPLKKRSVFTKIIAASARPYSGQMVNILTDDGRHLKVTDLHPMFVYIDSKWQLKYAKELQKGDYLPVFLGLPVISNQHKSDIKIDIKKINKLKFATIKVKSLSISRGDWVYSIETEKPHSFITSYGIAVHNCIPKDPLYLYWKAKHHGFKSRFIRLASEIITHMPEYVVERLDDLLKRVGKNLTKPNILIVGVTYKKDVKDLRKSPALDIIEILQKRNSSVSYYDPLIPYLKLNHLNLKSIDLNRKNLNKFDCVVIATDHSSVDYGLILRNSKLILDTRNVYKNIKNKKIFRL